MLTSTIVSEKNIFLVSSIKHCLTKGHRIGKELQCLTLQTYDNRALSRNTLKVTHSFFGGQMHTPDLHLRSVIIQSPIGSVPKASVLVFPPTTNRLKNLVISYQVLSVN